MAVKTKAKGKKIAPIKAKTTKNVKKAAKAKKTEVPAENKVTKKTMSIPKINTSNMAQIIYMATIIIFLAFVILKYHEII